MVYDLTYNFFNPGNQCLRIQRPSQNERHHSWNEHGPWESFYSPTKCMRCLISVLTEVTSALCPWCQHLNGVLLHHRTMSHCWPGGKIRAQKVSLNCTTRRLCGTMTHNPTCSISTAGSLRPPSRTSKSFTTMTVSTIPPNRDVHCWRCYVITVSLVSIL